MQIILAQLIFFMLIPGISSDSGFVWLIDTNDDWEQARAESTGLLLDDGHAILTADTGYYRSVSREFKAKRSAMEVTVTQLPVWQNWEPIEDIGPTNLRDAPVLLAVGANDVWMFGRYGEEKARLGFNAEPAVLAGFDLPLKTTPFPRQYDAPGGLKRGLGGYHAWQTRDMVHWVHHGPVTEAFSRWVTTAEYVNGTAYIYYDYPNDQDPHLYIDDDLMDGRPGENMGKVFDDPTDGSDCAIIRDKDGAFHMFYEDWSPINASARSWDSPLAGHAISPDGLSKFQALDPAVDRRTNDTGEIGTYRHPHWKSHEDWDSDIATYSIHRPEQEAYGDWAVIAVGEQYYLFGDYDPPGDDEMGLAWFTSRSMDEQFQRCGLIEGTGHPDPDIVFANGQFYLATQQQTDFVSPGPWVESVAVRVGVDVEGDGVVETWSDWETVSERYERVDGFSKQIGRLPARMDLRSLPSGLAFAFELHVDDATANESSPLLDSIRIEFR